ncbi:MAG: glycosyltransferase family 9 protein [Myxococcales bacterium]
MSDPKRVLVVRLSALGDVLLATPAVRALSRRFPAARVDWLVESAYLPLVEASPHARAVGYDKKGRHAGVRGLLALRRQLATERYDLVVDLQDKPKTRLFHSLAPECLAWHKRTPAQALLSLVGREKPMTRAHAIDLYFEALEPLGLKPDDRALELHLSPAHADEASRVVPRGRVAAIAPGARWANKRWPPERFAEVVRALRERGFAPLLLGGPGDAETLAAVRAALPDGIPDTAGLGIGGLAAAIERSAVVVSNDSGPVHLASALGVPVVALFGPTSPERWRPLSPRSEVVRRTLPCSPCSNHGAATCPLGHHDCLKDLPTEAVLAAVERVCA